MLAASKTPPGGVVRGPHGPRWEERPPRAPGPAEARVRVLLAGICRTDLHAAAGFFAVPTGRVLGHEFVGEITDPGHNGPFPAGTRVTANPLLPCGGCEGCAGGVTCFSPRMLGLDQDGAFADHVVLPWRALHAVPATLSPRRAAYAEPVAASLAVLRAPIAPGERGLLLGQNRIAELTLRVLKAHGFRGVTCLPHNGPLPENTFDFAIETVATEATLAGLLRAVRPGGCLVLKSRPSERIPLDIGLAVRRDLRLCAVGYGAFPEAIRLLSTLPVDDLLGEVFPLRRFEDAFAMARRSESAKLFLAP